MQHGSQKDAFGRFFDICWFVRGGIEVMVRHANGRFPAANRVCRFELGEFRSEAHNPDERGIGALKAGSGGLTRPSKFQATSLNQLPLGPLLEVIMTLMKSILLGSAAGIVAVAAAQAADLPTKKAAPADYVKICNVGGMAGFILPGSDTCFKISGYVTAQVEGGNLQTGFEWGFAPGLQQGTKTGAPVGTPVTLQAPTATTPTTAGFKPGKAGVVFGAPNSDRPSFGWSTRLNLTIDARQDTAYGVLRGYAEAQFENGNGFDNTGNSSYINRAYVQWAGITAGKANSFFSFFGGGPGWASFFSPDEQGYNQPDVLAYTATFGGGFSATIAIQSSGFVDNGAGTNMIATGNAAFDGIEAPDVVGVLRIDQAWGAAQLSGIAHQVRVSDEYGDAQNTWGWGVLGGVKFNLPTLGPGDDIQLEG